MNPQTTVASTTGIDARFLAAGQPPFRPAVFRKPPVLHSTPTVTGDATIDAAERERQESLEFLHKLVLG